MEERVPDEHHQGWPPKKKKSDLIELKLCGQVEVKTDKCMDTDGTFQQGACKGKDDVLPVNGKAIWLKPRVLKHLRFEIKP